MDTTKNETDSFGEWLKEQLRRYGMNQLWVANQLGMGMPTLQKVLGNRMCM